MVNSHGSKFRDKFRHRIWGQRQELKEAESNQRENLGPVLGDGPETGCSRPLAGGGGLAGGE